MYAAWRVQRGVVAVRRLPRWNDASTEGKHLRFVSVIVAVRDEGARIGETIKRLVAQEGIDLELVVVDDRSSDQTAAIVAQLAATDARIKLVDAGELPDGWLGKCHACWKGAQQARADWLLFTDGDAHMASRLLARAVSAAQSERANHVALVPSIDADAFWTQVALVGQIQLFYGYTAPDKINRDCSKRWAGIGAFNLIDRDTYFAIGGHQTLRMEVVEDMKLGYLVRKNGFRQRLYLGAHDLEVDWAKSVSEILNATEKNWFAAMDYRLWAAIASFVVLPATIVGTVFAPWFAGGWGWFAVAGWASLSVSGYCIAKDLGWRAALIAPFTSVGWLVFTAAGINSVWRTLRKGGIHWRDRFYPLDELRKGVVR